jgi:hypothetical protein
MIALELGRHLLRCLANGDQKALNRENTVLVCLELFPAETFATQV